MIAIERDTEMEDQEPIQTGSNDGRSDMEKEANLKEVNNWIRQLTHYINTGYRNNPQAKGVYMHLTPLLHESWSTALNAKDPDSKSLEALAELLREEARLRMPRHQRRMDLIKVKRGQDKHSDYLDKLGNLFTKITDPQMARIAMELLERIILPCKS